MCGHSSAKRNLGLPAIGVAVRGSVFSRTLSYCGRTFKTAVNKRGDVFYHGLFTSGVDHGYSVNVGRSFGLMGGIAFG